MKFKNIRKKLIILAIITIFPTLCFINYNRDSSWNFQGLSEEVFYYPKISWDYGNGSIENPRVLENKTFIGTGSNGYYLYDKTYHFIIRNCTFIDSGTGDDNAGLKLVAVQNGVITNNTFLSCYNGIYLAGQLSKQCKNILVNDNKFVDNINGILITYSAININITHNRFSNNNDGVELTVGCNDNYIINNTFTSDMTGVTMKNTQNNLIYSNTIVGSSFSGIYLLHGGPNIVRDNILRNNDIGILLDHSILNMIYRNEFRNNNDGIWFQSNANDNVFYNNTFISNIRNAHETSPTSNSYSYNGYGNSWDDYQGYDCNNDGVGETPYVSGIVTDNFPLCSRLDTFVPIISIIEPAIYSEYESNSPSFTLTIEEYLIQSQWYTLDGGVSNFTITGLTDVINQPFWDGLDFGEYNLTFYVQDLAGNVGSANVVISKKEEEPKEEEPEQQISFGTYYLTITIISIFSVFIIIRKKSKFYIR